MINGEKSSDDAVYVALSDRYALVRVEGRGSFKVSTSFKQFAETVIQKKIPLILIDMSRCIGMDSTFMGVTAGIASRIKKQAGDVVMVNCSERTHGLLATLGLDQLISAYATSATPPGYNQLLSGKSSGEQLPAAPGSNIETIKTMLDAHQQIVTLAPETLPQFKDVIAYLGEEVARKTSTRQEL